MFTSLVAAGVLLFAPTQPEEMVWVAKSEVSQKTWDGLKQRGYVEREGGTLHVSVRDIGEVAIRPRLEFTFSIPWW